MSGRPNILLVMTDQQRADFCSHEGFPLATTPTLDQVAREGVRFARAYTPSPVCLPARCSLFTGRFATAHGMRSNYFDTSGIRYARDLIDVLKDAGYVTALFGKNHSHLDRERLDAWREYGHASGCIRDANRRQDLAFDQWLDDLHHGVSEAPTPFPLDCQYPVRIVQDALQYFDAYSDRPKFAWVSFPEPHSPFQVPAPYYGMFPPDGLPDRAAGPEVLPAKGGPWDWQYRHIQRKVPGYEGQWRRYRANYLGMVRLIDDQFGILLQGLQARNAMETTHVIFVSDHGDFTGDYGLLRKGVGLPEVLIRVPMIWRGPGVKATDAGREPFVSLIDIFPTICEILGVDIPEGMQGRSLLPILTGLPYPAEEFSSIFAEYGFGGRPLSDAGERDFGRGTCSITNRRGKATFDEINDVTNAGTVKMVRHGDWKLIYTYKGMEELYNVKEDPYELRNLLEEAACRLQRDHMRLLLIEWMARLDDTIPFDRYTRERDVRRNYA